MLHSLRLVCTEYFVRLPSSSQVFLRICRTIFQRYFSVKSHLKYLRNYKSRKLSFACISSLTVLKVLGQSSSLLIFSSGNHRLPGTRFEHVNSEKDCVTGLEVTLQSSSRIFQVTGLTFSPQKFM